MTNLIKGNEGVSLRFNFTSILLIFISVSLLVLSTFFQITFDYGWILGKSLGIKQYFYVPQLPIILMIATVLGPKMGAVSILLYILLGMFKPVFALGGGIEYVLETGFGYILAYIPAIIISGLILSGKLFFKKAVKAAFWATLTIHSFGLVYALLVMIINHSIFGNVKEFIMMQSSLKFIIDFIISVPVIYIGYLFKTFIGLALPLKRNLNYEQRN